MRMTLSLVLSSAAAILIAASNAAAQTIRVPRTSVTMTAPEGFKPAREFVGLENTETGATIRITELAPEAYEGLAESLSSPKTASARFASQGIRITRIEPLAVGDAQAPFAIGGAEVQGRPIVKYMTVLGGAPAGSRTVWVVVDVPDASSLSRTAVETALQSIKIARLPTLDEKVSRLPFRFEPHAPFQTANADANAVVLSTTGKMESSRAVPAIVIERAGTTALPSEAAALNERLLRRSADFGSAPIAEQGKAAFAGGDAHFIVATSGEVTVYQILRIMPGGRYIRLSAGGETSAIQGLRETIDQIAASVTLPE